MKAILDLEKFAEKQCGFFTYKQAISLGVQNQNHKFYINSGKWEKVDRGLFRVKNVAETEYDKFVMWSLWSRNKDDQPQGVISHQSALYYYGFAKEKESSVHLTVPKSFRKNYKDKKGIIIHKENLQISELDSHNGFMTTNLFRTLKDTKDKLEQDNKWGEIAEEVAMSGRLTQTELQELCIFTPTSETYRLYQLDNTCAHEQQYKGVIFNRNEKQQKEAAAKRVFESIQNQGTWSMNSNSYINGKSQQRGFTLVELLVVIAVISILAGMLLPALENAIAAAHQISCISKMKQIALAASLYAEDSENYPPSNPASYYNYLYNRSSESTGTPFPNYLEVPKEYHDSNSKGNYAPPISQCPMGGRDGTTELSKETGPPNFTYGFNTFIREARISSVSNPSGRLFISELNEGGSYSLYGRDCFRYQHNDFVNILYIDMHTDPAYYFDVAEYHSSATRDPYDFYKEQ
jgi:prepilin-type N-terminal cleavage/methylation domain-containing protein